MKDECLDALALEALLGELGFGEVWEGGDGDELVVLTLRLSGWVHCGAPGSSFRVLRARGPFRNQTPPRRYMPMLCPVRGRPKHRWANERRDTGGMRRP